MGAEYTPVFLLLIVAFAIGAGMMIAVDIVTDTEAVRSARRIAVVLGLLGGLFLVLAIAFATFSVREPRVGDTSAYKCSPVGTAFDGSGRAIECAPHVVGRLGDALAAGLAGGGLTVIALLIALGAAGEVRQASDR